MTRKKKNGIMLLVLCVVLAGAVLLYYFLPQRMEDKETGMEETESIIEWIRLTAHQCLPLK